MLLWRFRFSKLSQEMVIFFFVVPLLSKSHMNCSSSVATATYFHGGLYRKQAATRRLLAYGGAQKDQERIGWHSVGDKGALSGAREDQGRVGRHPEA